MFFLHLPGEGPLMGPLKGHGPQFGNPGARQSHVDHQSNEQTPAAPPLCAARYVKFHQTFANARTRGDGIYDLNYAGGFKVWAPAYRRHLYLISIAIRHLVHRRGWN